jgi:hypothetical protein
MALARIGHEVKHLPGFLHRRHKAGRMVEGDVVVSHAMHQEEGGQHSHAANLARPEAMSACKYGRCIVGTSRRVPWSFARGNRQGHRPDMLSQGERE